VVAIRDPLLSCNCADYGIFGRKVKVSFRKRYGAWSFQIPPHPHAELELGVPRGGDRLTITGDDYGLRYKDSYSSTVLVAVLVHRNEQENEKKTIKESTTFDVRC